MFTAPKRALALLLVLLALPLGGLAEAAFVPTLHHTQPEPEPMVIETPDLRAYTLLHETPSAQYYWREDRDILAILDRASGYVWKTGQDIGFSKEIKAKMDAAQTPEELLLAAEPIEKSMNATYIGVANSFVTVEYRDGKIFYIGSAAEKDAKSTLSPVENEPGRFRLDMDFTGLDLQLTAFITLEELGYKVDVPAESITGKGRALLSALWLTPFLGATGGEAEYFDPSTGEHGEAVPKPAVPGYALVPDGSGALIRFLDNSVPFVEYIGDVYGPDPATQTYYTGTLTDAAPLKNPLMPVFGIAHGQRQAAFVAFATKGAQHLSIMMRPEENLRLKYNFCYPRFEYNIEYYRVYNRKGSGYFTMGSQLFDYDLGMTYRFLHGDGADGSPAADYAGMALAYREALRESGDLKAVPAPGGDIPLRLDFILSDMKKSLVGHEQVVVATARDVGEMVDEVLSLGITNVNGGLMGWQAGAGTLAKPGSFRFFKGTGTRTEIENLFRDAKEKGVDLSLARDYSRLNPKMTSYLNTAAKHINTWYLLVNTVEDTAISLVNQFSYARPDTAAEWLRDIARQAADFSQTLTVSGITDTLVSTYDRLGPVLSATQALETYREAFGEAGQTLGLNLERPNLYLWEYAKRFLQLPVGGSQYIFQTDEVPFLQMVLHGAGELYGPYSNFSFYTQEDILRMVDYNLSPAFILSKLPSHLLSDTLSRDLYSTEFEQYKQLIVDIYTQVNAALSPVQGYEWVGRLVPENGLVVNTYEKGGDIAHVLINYTESPLGWQGYGVPALSARTVKEGGAP